MKRIALALVAVLLPLPALAGTTGRMTGIVRDSRDGAPLANVSVVASSPTQIARTKTDSHGRYCFMSLTPDRYFVEVQLDGYSPEPYHVAIFADMPKHLSPWLTQAIEDFRHFPILNAGALVQEGTSGDVYGYAGEGLLVAPPVQSDYWMLRILPGITVGPGAPLIH